MHKSNLRINKINNIMSSKNQKIIKFFYSNLLVTAYICIAAICIFVIQGCNRDNIKPITTKQVVEITATSAKTGGIINANNAGGPHGVCFNTTGAPTLNDYHTLDGYGPCEFNTQLTGLKPGTTYYVRAYYCSNTHYDDVTYGNEVSFTTLSVPEPHTALELLTIPKGWVLSTATSAPAYQMQDGSFAYDLINDGYLLDFEIDDVIHFLSNGTHYVNPGTLLPADGDGYTQETSLGQWFFDNPNNPSYLYMQIPFFYGAQGYSNTYDPALEECRLLSLTTDMLKIKYSFSDNENPAKGYYTFTLTYVPAH